MLSLVSCFAFFFSIFVLASLVFCFLSHIIAFCLCPIAVHSSFSMTLFFCIRYYASDYPLDHDRFMPRSNQPFLNQRVISLGYDTIEFWDIPSLQIRNILIHSHRSLGSALFHFIRKSTQRWSPRGLLRHIIFFRACPAVLGCTYCICIEGPRSSSRHGTGKWICYM